jgi:hypothetical protein
MKTKTKEQKQKQNKTSEEKLVNPKRKRKREHHPDLLPSRAMASKFSNLLVTMRAVEIPEGHEGFSVRVGEPVQVLHRSVGE